MKISIPLFKIISHGSLDYKKCVTLREEILRKPLGLAFTREELEKEKDYIHIAGYIGSDLCATSMLIPEEKRLKMRQVAVSKDLQGNGIASAMLEFCDDYAAKNGFKEIYCHVRATAIPFYEKNDYVLEGNFFIETSIPHRKMNKVIR